MIQLLCLSVVSLTLSAEPLPKTPVPTARQGPEALAEAERGFAAQSDKLGRQASFLANLAADSVVFTPQAENGPAAQRADKEDGGKLSWLPAHVETSASGDFGISTGPWTWREKAGDEPKVHGHYLSLWAIIDGRWQVLLDIGVSHPVQDAEKLATQASTAPAMPTAKAALDAAWAAFDKAAGADLGAALKAQAAADLRLYRKGQPVVPGAPDATAAAAPTSLTWHGAGQRVAPSVDLAVRWGQREGAAGKASAVQVWRREGTAWKLAMDAQLPLPAAKP